MNSENSEDIENTEVSSSAGVRYQKKDFWSVENLKYSEPHFRLMKCSRIVNEVAGGRESDLLDVGCGPSTLMSLLGQNIHYYGIDIAIRNPAPNLIEADFVETPIVFGARQFDIVVAQGVFEYVGNVQAQKFAEVAKLLRDNGVFIASYVNFGHRDRQIYVPYNNVQPLEEFRRSLSDRFRIVKAFPTSHNWNHTEPGRKLMKWAQLPLNINVPFVSPILGVEYFFICRAR